MAFTAARATIFPAVSSGLGGHAAAVGVGAGVPVDTVDTAVTFATGPPFHPKTQPSTLRDCSKVISIPVWLTVRGPRSS